MVRLRDPFGVALDGLRAGLREGRFGLGAALVAADLAPSLSISATPLREALSRLAGEGLIEDRRGRGYFTHRLEPGELEDLYTAHLACTCAALNLQRAYPSGLVIKLAPGDAEPSTIRDQTEVLFSAVLRAGENDVLIDLHQRIADRLALVRCFEPLVLDGTGDELLELADLWTQKSFAKFEQKIEAFHRRRIAQSKSLGSALRRLRV